MFGLLPSIMAAGFMIGFMPNGVPVNKAGLLAGYFLSGLQATYLQMVMAWNAS